MPDITFYSNNLQGFHGRQTQLNAEGTGLVNRGSSFFQFFTLSRSRRKENAAENVRIAYDFRAALVRQYGSRVADFAFAKHIGKPGARLDGSISADKLRSAIATAERAAAFKQAMTNAFGAVKANGAFDRHIVMGARAMDDRTMERIAREDGMRDTPGQRLADALTETLRELRANEEDLVGHGEQRGRFLALVDGIEDLPAQLGILVEEGRELSRTPHNPLEGVVAFQRKVGEFHQRKQNLMQRLESFHSALQRDDALRRLLGVVVGADRLDVLLREVRGVLTPMHVELLEQSFRMEAALASRPSTQRSVDIFTRNWTQAAVRVADNLPESEAKTELAMRLRRIGERLAAGEVKPLQTDEFREKMAGVEKELVALLRRCYGPGQRVPSEKEIKRELRGAWVQVMNAQPWERVDKQFTVTYLGEARRMRSAIVPAGRMALPPVVGQGTLFPAYEGRGVCCADFGEQNHPTNLARTEFAFENGQVFLGLRHGIHAAIDAPEGQQRQANLNRARESAVAALALKLERNPGLLDHEPIELNLTSISLVSPDSLRSGHNGERRMLNDQTQAWRDLMAENNGALTLRVGNLDVRVVVNVATFNYGVNAGAMRFIGRPIGIWSNSAVVNDSPTGKQAFRNRVTSFLQNNPNHPDRAAITALRDQIERIWTDESFMGQGNEPYKLVARLAVLTDLMGDVPLWNCKSGKDRTGQMDVETKFLYAKIRLTGSVPEPDADLTEDDVQLLRRIALDGGNHEVQVQNTGMAGFKLGSVPVNYSRMDGGVDGGDLVGEIHKGGGYFVKA